MKRALLVLLAAVATQAWSLDTGGSVDTSLGVGASLTSNLTTNLWATGSLGGQTSFQLRSNLTNAFTLGLDSKHAVTNTVSVGLDALSLDSSWFRLGRSDFRDFTGVTLNTKLDGVQLMASLAQIDFKAFVGTSRWVFKSGSTIVISEEDEQDRQVYENIAKPATLWAPPRVVGGWEASAAQWLPDQNFQLSLLAQADLRPNPPSSGQRAMTDVTTREGAPVSTAYAGLGWGGRIAGPVYGAAWAYGVGGTSLTPVGAPVTIASTDRKSPDVQYQIWRSSYLLGGLGNVELTVLLPSLQYLLLNAGVQLGSWDPNGASPSQNSGITPISKKPSLFTGWTGISRTGGALLFNPQPSNLLSGRLLASMRPSESLQVASSTFVSARPTPADITEAGLAPKSKELYLGTESDLAVLWRPTSDFVGSISVGAFLPNPKAMTRKFESKLQLAASLSF